MKEAIAGSIFKKILSLETSQAPKLAARSLIASAGDLADAVRGLGLHVPGFDVTHQTSRYRKLIVRLEQIFVSSRSELTYELPNKPLEVDILVQEGGLPIPEEDFALILACVKWEIEPPFPEGGRSSWLQYQQPRKLLDAQRTTVAAIKIKGGGTVVDKKALPPSTSTFFHGDRLLGPGLGQLMVLQHMGIRDDGSFYPVLDQPKPLGGITLSRARVEFEITKHLMNAGASAVLPIAYGKFGNLQYQGEPLGFVILASSVSRPNRMGYYFEPVEYVSGRVVDLSPPLTALVCRRFDVLDRRGAPMAVAKTVSELFRACGTTMRGFHNAGVCRFAGHTGNFQYDEEKRIAIQHDFDSSVLIESVAPNARGLSILRDLSSALFRLAHSVMHARLFILFDDNCWGRHNPFNGWLLGYFPDIDSRSVIPVGDRIAGLYRTALKTMPHYGTLEFTSWFPKFSYDFTVEVIEMLMPLFQKSRLGTLYPLPYGPGEVYRAHMARYREQVQWQGEQAMLVQMSARRS